MTLPQISSREGTTQGDPTAMATYALGLVPLIDVLLNIENKGKMVAFADDLTGADNLEQLHMWWMKFLDIGPKYGYFLKPEEVLPYCKRE